MNQEAKLLSGEGTAFEQAMLRSVKGEAPSPALTSQMMGPLVAAPPPLTLPPAPLPGAGLATSGAAKWAGAAVLTVGMGGALVFGALRGESTKPVEATTVPNQAQELNATPNHAQPLGNSPETADPPPDRTADSAATKTVHRAGSHAAPEKAARAESDRLAEEMRLLDQARAALAQKAPEKALRLLGTYDARYPQGTLREEATVLRVSALKGTGKQSQAAELAEKFLEESPNSAHKSRLQAEDGAQEPAR